MINYIKRRFSSEDVPNESTDNIITIPSLSVSPINITTRQSAPESKLMSHEDISNLPTRSISYANQFLNLTKDVVNQQPGIGLLSPSQSMSKEKFKLLFVIDDRPIDWRKYFKNKNIFADYDIQIEQAEFKEIHLSAYSNGGILIDINVYRDGIHVVRSFRPDFVLVRQYVKDVNVDWTNIILGMQYGAVPSVNSMRALYNFRDKPWIFAELLKIQRRLGAEQFPLINQTYYPNYKKMFISPAYPSVLKIGQAHQGFGKIRINNTYNYHDLTSIIEMSKCYSTIEQYIDGQCDIYIQKIGHNYKAFSRKSLTGNWKANTGFVEVEQIELTDRYRLWIDEVSQIFGGLDICAIELVRSKDGKEFIIDINDCTMQLASETQEEDYQSIAELVIHKMQIYCRPDQQQTILTRISSFDELPKLSQNKKLNSYSSGNIRPTSNTIHTDDILANLKKVFSGFFGNIIS